MLRLIAVALLAAMAAVVRLPAQAQNAPSSPPALSPQATPAQPPVGRFRLTDEERAKARDAARICREELRARDLPRGERRVAMRSCVAGKVPEIAARRASWRAEREKFRADLRRVRDQCRDDVSGRGLRGDERRRAMRMCLVEKRPELARPMACAEEAREKGLRRSPERRDFMRSCLQRA